MPLTKPTDVQASAEGIAFKGPAEAWKYKITVANHDRSLALPTIYIPAPRSRTVFILSWFDFDLHVAAPANFKEGMLTLKIVAATNFPDDDSEEASVQFNLTEQDVTIINRAIQGPKNAPSPLAATLVRPEKPTVIQVSPGEWIEVDHHDRTNVRYQVDVTQGAEPILEGEAASLPIGPTRIEIASLRAVSDTPLNTTQYFLFVQAITLRPHQHVSESIRVPVTFTTEQVRVLNKHFGVSPTHQPPPAKTLVFALILASIWCFGWVSMNGNKTQVYARAERGGARYAVPDPPIPDGLSIVPLPPVTGTNIPLPVAARTVFTKEDECLLDEMLESLVGLPIPESVGQVAEPARPPTQTNLVRTATRTQVATSNSPAARRMDPVAPPAHIATSPPTKVAVAAPTKKAAATMYTGSQIVTGNGNVVGNIFNAPVQILHTTNINR